MIIAAIFLLHIIFIIYIFFRKWKQDSISSALTNLGLIILLFSVGWSVSTLIINIFIDEAGFGKHFDKNTLVLTILTIGEYFFYRIYYRDLFIIAGGKEK